MKKMQKKVKMLCCRTPDVTFFAIWPDIRYPIFCYQVSSYPVKSLSGTALIKSKFGQTSVVK